MIKHIGFYGHSNCAYRSPDSFIDMIATHYSADIVNLGVRQGSEDRILFELKKTKKLDLAIIFHSEPQYIFLPGCDRDIGLNQVDEQRAEYLFKDWDSNFNKTHHKKFYLHQALLVQWHQVYMTLVTYHLAHTICTIQYNLV